MRTTRSIFRLRTMLAALFATLALVVPAPAQATLAGPVGRIAFDDYFSGQIYAVNPDGSGLIQVTHIDGPRIAVQPSWTSDGHLLFTVVNFRTRNNRIWIANADGTDAQMVSGDLAGYRDDGPSMTPDGRYIVFTRCEPGEEGLCAIWRMRSDGTHKEALTPYQRHPNKAFDYMSSISADGRQIAFSHYDGDGISVRVYVMGIDGSNPHPVSAPREVGCNPSWNPDGATLAFISRCNQLSAQVETMDTSGGHVRRLTGDPYPNGAYTTAYSPDGAQIAFSDDRRYDDFCCVDLFVMDADGTHEHRIPLGQLMGIYWVSWGTAPLVHV